MEQEIEKQPRTSYDFAKFFNSITVNRQKVSDFGFEDEFFKGNSVTSKTYTQQAVVDAISNNNVDEMRAISTHFMYNGLYSRLLRYLATIYRYDWYVVPYVMEYHKHVVSDVTNQQKEPDKKMLQQFYACLKMLDDFKVKKTMGEISLKVLQNGAYYGYRIKAKDTYFLQELPVSYCRSRFYSNNKPIVEFNMSFFDDKFRTKEERERVLKAFPAEFTKGYKLYKAGKLPATEQGGKAGWYILDPDYTIKFSFNNDDSPPFISVIPLLYDLDEAREVDKKRGLQSLVKLLIQKMPVDKNGELLFDVDEAAQLHKNAVKMVADAVGVTVLTTFADVEMEELADNNTATNQNDSLQRIERQIFNESGVSQMLFNTDGNIALEKSQINDESVMYNLIAQYEVFLNTLVDDFNNSPKKYYFSLYILPTTCNNYKELSKMFKEQMQIGFGKMFPQLAMGIPQSCILANAYFENDILDLVNVFIPPLMSSTMNTDILNQTKDGGNAGNGTSKEGAGRPEKEDGEKSTKTIQNQESMS